MALKSITIENFKCIGDAVTIPIRPITLLFGKNSSGKSTVLQALRYMAEVWGSPEEADSGGMKTDYTALGNFQSLVHRHDKKRKIHIRLDFDLSTEELECLNNHLHYGKESGADELKSLSIEAVTGWDDTNEKTYTESFIYRLNGVEWIWVTPTERQDIFPNDRKRLSELKYIRVVPVSILIETGAKWISLEDNTKHWNFNHPYAKRESRKGYSYDRLRCSDLESLSKDVLEGKIQSDIEKIVAKNIKNINYLGPFREVPLREFEPKKDPDESLWIKGREAWNILCRDSTLLEKTNSYMEDFLNFGYKLKVQDFSYRGTTVLKIHDKENEIDLDLPDVGFGISQLIPVLVLVSATEQSENHNTRQSISVIEQPELHIHPAAQVALGDVFIDGIKSSASTFLIETHSEHLLLRLLRRVRETTEGEQTDHILTPEDLSIVYVRPTPEGIKFTPISITDDGDFYAPWPEGFFEERVKELF